MTCVTLSMLSLQHSKMPLAVIKLDFAGAALQLRIQHRRLYKD